MLEETFNFNVPKNENCVIIDVNNWLRDSESLIQNQKMSGKLSLTYITKAIESYTPSVTSGQAVLLSRAASEVAQYLKFEIDSKYYYNVPQSQILGVFDSINYEGLIMLNSNLLVKRIKNTTESELLLNNANVMIGEVVKKSDNVSKVNIGDKILIRDNITTEVSLNGSTYHALEDRMIVGIFKNSLNIQDLQLINESILLKPYVSSKVLNSTILISPDINFEDLDYSDMYNRDLFEIKYIDNTIKNLKKGDKVLLNKDYTNYVYYGMEKYFIIDGLKYILAKIIE